MELTINNIGLKNSKLEHLSNKLNVLLASFTIYYHNLRGFHWHIKGPHFFELHRLFEELYNESKIKIDNIAERILTLNFSPKTSLEYSLKNAKISEANHEIQDSQMIEVLIENHIKLIDLIREILVTAGELEDEGTIDILAGYLQEFEKINWQLHAWNTRKN